MRLCYLRSGSAKLRKKWRVQKEKDEDTEEGVLAWERVFID